MSSYYLKSVLLQFNYYKELGDKTIDQIPENKLSYKVNAQTNSINTIVKHLSGNMASRWSDFLTTDGEKKWRNREDEFNDTIQSKEDLIHLWNKGWEILFNSLEQLTDDDLEKINYIRNEGHTVVESINRQLCHYSYHVGQLVYLGVLICGKDWNSLSIPKGESDQFNSDKFSKPKTRKNFLED